MAIIREATLGMDFGFGVNDATGEARHIAVTGVLKIPFGGSAQTVTGDLTKIENTESLQKSLKLSIDAEGSYGLFAAYNKFDYVTDTKVNDHQVYILLRVIVENPFSQIENEELVDSAKTLLMNDDKARFREEFGDLYVKGVITGGEFYAVIFVETHSETDQTSVSDTLEAGGVIGAGAFDVAAQVSSNVKKVSETHAVRIHVFQRAGSESTASFETDIDKVIERARTFPTIVKNNPFPYRVLLQDYLALDLPKPPDFLQLQNAKEVLQEITSLRTPLFTIVNNIDFILSHPDQFENPAPNVNLNGVRDTVASAIQKLTDAGSQCIQDINKCAVPTGLNLTDLTNLTLPKRKGGPTLAGLGELFQGNWQNPNNQENLLSVVITPIDQIHADVKTRYKGFPNEFDSTAEWNDAAKALFLVVTLQPGHTQIVGGIPIHFPALGSNVEIAEMPNSAQTLVVTNDQGRVPVGQSQFGASVRQVSTFSRSGA